MMNHKIKVLVAEDSTVTRRSLVQLLESDPQIEVIGAVGDGQAALDFVKAQKPDAVLMDMHMARLDGFEATRRIMETQAVPIVICSASTGAQDVATTFRAMEAGAIACVEKPVDREHPNFETSAAHLLETLKLMSEVKVVRRTLRAQWQGPVAGSEKRLAPDPGTTMPIQLIGIGASTGGPPVLQTIFAGLPKDFPVPILVVQHIARGFLAGMVEWLNQTTSLQIHLASHEVRPLPGHIYLAPDDFHMGVSQGGNIVLSKEDPESHLRPAVSFLFRSLTRVYGPGAVGVLLTGMGRDGAEELKTMKDRGATTIAQDRDSSVVHGMPGVAISLGGATHVRPANRIADTLITLVTQSRDVARNRHVA